MVKSHGSCHLLAAIVLLAGCGPAPAPPPAAFTTGFWFWSGSAAKQPQPIPSLDTLYFHAGNISVSGYLSPSGWSVRADIPPNLPPARQYWAVYRFDQHGIPDAKSLPYLHDSFRQLAAQARYRNLPLAGFQLDIDSPTNALPRYAEYLQAVRPGLPQDTELSITALLDWFRSRAAFGKVAAAIDEFVPQFYDLEGPRESYSPASIAAPLSAAEWAPRFNRFQKRFRVGISTFGRARALLPPNPQHRAYYYSGAKPFDFGVHPHFALETSRTPAGELRLRYRATQSTKIEYREFEPGSGAEFVLATPESIRDAVAQARQLGPYCAGVLFFRWPSFGETLAAPPADVLSAAGVLPVRAAETELRTRDGGCAAVQCTDLILFPGSRLSAHPASLRIRSTAPIEYILPEAGVPLRLASPLELTLKVPAYTARGELQLGRVVTAQPARLTLETP